jgi:hypothetical protein
LETSCAKSTSKERTKKNLKIFKDPPQTKSHSEIKFQATHLKGSHYPLEVVLTSLLLKTQSSASFRCIEAIFGILHDVFGFEWTPTHATIQNWLLRYSTYQLNSSKPSGKWTLLIDFAVKVGGRKCLIILGIREDQLKDKDNYVLSYSDMEPLLIELMEKGGKEKVKEAIDKVIKVIGVPQSIVIDHGADIKGGANLIQKEHPSILVIYDIIHYLGCLMRAEFYKSQDWQSFSEKVTETKQKVKQTAASFLAPPHQRKKARWINIDCVTDWAGKIIKFHKHFKTFFPADFFKSKFGWINSYKQYIEEYEQIVLLARLAREQVRKEGLHRLSEQDFIKATESIKQLTIRGQRIKASIQKYLREEGAKARNEQRLIGSTEILESLIGKYKHQAQNSPAQKDFTTMTLHMASIIGTKTKELVEKAFQAIPLKEAYQYCKKIIGESDFSKIKQAFNCT